MLLAGTPEGLYRVSVDRPDSSTADAAVEQMLEKRSVRALERAGETVFAAMASGLLASDDAGERWRTLDLPADSVHAVHQVDGQLYAGVGPAAVCRSGDGGESWHRLEGFDALADGTDWPTNEHRDRAWVRDITTPAEQPATLLVGVEVGGLVVSTDGGQSWRQHDELPDDVHDIVAVTPERWVVSCGVGGPGGHGGVYETRDAGVTWLERDTGERDYVRESHYRDRLYTAGNRDGPPWTPPDAALFVETDGTLEPVSYPGCPESYIISWAQHGEQLFAGTNTGTILRGPGDWERLGAVPVAEQDRRAWGVRSLAWLDR